ncbi:HEPN domain-containing protein [Thermococcus pacificus]|uniref:HEPN domain-containing protein n=1 Tax=Thermococcus pacificus TaxID=71998 RepID=UPI000B59C628|nr:HEPN domain-containing protein [Thermococcus pacificus]
MAIPEEVFRHLELAEEELSSAKILLQNSKLRDAISRAYYSMFHAAKALLLVKGLNPRKHSGVIRMFGLHFVDEGFVERIYAKYLTSAFSLRSKADYDVYYEPTEEKAQALSEFLRTLRERFGDSIEEVILFGSYVRGDYDEESDIDVLIVGEVDFDELMEIVTDILLKHGELVSPIVIKPEEFKRRKDSFIRTVLEEGKPLYSSTSTP